MAGLPRHDIASPELAEQGAARIDWASRDMPVLGLVRQRLAESRPLEGCRIAACMHVTSETANLLRCLQAGGAEVALCASNSLTTLDDVAAALVVEHGIPVFAIQEADETTFRRHVGECLQLRPHLCIDDGAHLAMALHEAHRDCLGEVRGGTEETNTGVTRLKAMMAKGLLEYPVFSVNDAETKRLFDHRYGTGQTTVDGLLRATNILLCGRVVVVCGYGWCGRGVATRARGFGANVVITEVNPVRALEAVMDGYRVLPMGKAATEGDIFITVTGDVAVITREHFAMMKDGALVCNSGQTHIEIDIEGLESLATAKRQVRPYVTEYDLGDGRAIRLLSEGRLINLSAAEGHPSSVMDMNFANQALSVEYLLRADRPALAPAVHRIPTEIDEEVARLKLASLGISIDTLTDQQRQYLASWGHQG